MKIYFVVTTTGRYFLLDQKVSKKITVLLLENKSAKALPLFEKKHIYTRLFSNHAPSPTDLHFLEKGRMDEYGT